MKCKRCELECARHQHLINHLNKKTPCVVKGENIAREVLIQEVIASMTVPKDASKYSTCEWCDAEIFKTNMSRHKKTCPEKPDDIDVLKHQLEELKTKYDNLVQMQGVSSIVINDNSTNIVNVVNINSFGNENKEHIDDEYVKHCLLNRLQGMKSLLEKLHFSDEAPENKNIRMKSLKKSLVEVKGDDAWVIKDANEAMEMMISKGCSIANKYFIANKYIINPENGLQEYNLDELDQKIQMFLSDLMSKNTPMYYALRRRMLALIIEHSDNYV